MRQLIIIVILFFKILTCFSQASDEKTSYGKLETKKWQQLASCKPCILEYYENGKLFSRAVQYTDCIVGFYKEFYPSGKLKILGHYKENLTGDWKDIYERGLCISKDGEWIHYNENGTISTKEYWKDNKFIKQIPELTFNEIWNTELTLNGNKLDNNAEIQLNDIKELVIKPYFKNKSKAGIKLSDSIEISANGRPLIKTVKTDPNLKETLIKKGFLPTDKVSLTLFAYNNQKRVGLFFLKVKQ